MKRLYLKLYIALLGVGLVSLVVAAVAFHLLVPERGMPRPLREMGVEVLRERLPPPGQPVSDDVLAQLAAELELELVLWNHEGERLAEATQSPFRDPRRWRPGVRRSRRGPVVLLELEPEGRWLGARDPQHSHGRSRARFILTFFALLMALGCYPIARRVARRLERLEASVKRWGHGELHARAVVEGNDEVASLATSFNDAATRLEALVEDQRRMLANASHEFRSPLARLRLALELLSDEPDDAARGRIAQGGQADVEELDRLVEDILVTARGHADAPRRPWTSFDLFELVSDLAAPLGIAVMGTPLSVQADAVMLKHLVRNLLENAHRHAGGCDAKVHLERLEDKILLRVEDGGPGVLAEDQARIFEPFYRTRNARGERGVGLGLALVRQVAEHHGGTVRYEARRPQGSIFIVEFPGHLAQRSVDLGD